MKFALLFFLIIVIFYFSFSYFTKNTFETTFLNNDKFISFSKVPKDGSCFYHSVLYSISKTYRISNSQQKENMAQKFRQNLYDYFSRDIWSQKYKCFCKYESIKYNLLHEWAGNIEWNIVTDYLDINIAIFREKDQSLYWYNFDNNEIKYDPNKRLILILNKYCFHKH